MHVPINVKSPNNISEWQMGFNSAFKGLIVLCTRGARILGILILSLCRMHGYINIHMNMNVYMVIQDLLTRFQ